MKKIIAILLAFAMTAGLCACGKTEEPEVKEPALQVAETPAPVTEPVSAPPETVEEPVAEPQPTWDDLVGVWYLKTCYIDENEVISEEVPGFWDAYENNTDARITFTDTDGIDYYWATKYEVSEEYEDLPHQIVDEPVSEEYDFADWCVTAQSPYGTAYRIGLADEDTLVCYETYGGELGYESSYKCIYTKEGPIEFHKNILDPDYLTGCWYMNSSEVDGDLSYCADTGVDCWICFDGEGRADFYEGNIYFPEEANYVEGCEYRVLEEPVLGWVDDAEYPERQDWSVEVDIPSFYAGDEDYYQFGLTDEYTLTMYHEIIADGGSYHVGSVCEFSWYSPFDGDEYAGAEMPEFINGLVESAGEGQWLVAICCPGEELSAELDEEGWELNDMSYLYGWENPQELILVPVGMDVELAFCTGSPVYENGEFSYWEDGECMYNPELLAGELWRGIVDMPTSPEDATLCLHMGFGSEGLNGGEEYFIRVCNFNAENGELYINFI